ncbi:MAG: AMP-binding protein [Actinomycetota bacterium]|jgi:carnitine-CoA ligase
MHLIDTTDLDSRVVGDVLRRQAEAAGDAPFLLNDDVALTFDEVNRRADQLAAGLARLGIGPGNPLALFLENSLDFVLLALAANKLGAAWIPTNTAYKGEWLRDTLVDGGAPVLVVDRSMLGRVADLAGDIPAKHVVVRAGAGDERLPGQAVSAFEELAVDGAGSPGVTVGARDLSAVMWTSGTTGRSKGVMQTHSAWLACAEIFVRARDTRPGDVFYCCVPLFNSGGWVLNVFCGLVAGLPVAIDPGFSVRTFWDRCRHYRATQVVTLGAMHMYLWQAPATPSDADNPVRVAGFVPLPPELTEPMKERFGLEFIWQGFGQSEVMPMAITSRDGAWSPGSCGFPRPDLDVRILDEHGNEVGAEEVGEICVRARRPGVMFSGYYGRPDDTLSAFTDLWYHSGDLGRLSATGELFFVDRAADYMRHKGRNVSSFEVERVFLSHPAVAEAAAHGVAAEELASEDEIKVCVVLRPGEVVTEEELARFVNERAPYYFVPRYIELLAELPHTPTERVQKFRLRQRGVTPGTWDRDAAGFTVTRD